MLCFKGYHQENEKTTYRMKEKFYKSYIWGGIWTLTIQQQQQQKCNLKMGRGLTKNTS